MSEPTRSNRKNRASGRATICGSPVFSTRVSASAASSLGVPQPTARSLQAGSLQLLNARRWRQLLGTAAMIGSMIWGVSIASERNETPEAAGLSSLSAWHDGSVSGRAGAAKSSNDSTQSLARFLWEGDHEAPTGGTTRYLWEESSRISRYLWDEPAQVTRYLWDEPVSVAAFLWGEFAERNAATTDEVIDSVMTGPLDQASASDPLAATGNRSPLSSEVPLSVSARAADRVNAMALHEQGLTGAGVGVAIIDTGMWNHPSLTQDSKGQSRVKVVYDATSNDILSVASDIQGHGSHIAAVLASSRVHELADPDTGEAIRRFEGIAPDVDLVIVKAFDDQSRADYLDVVRAIDFVIQNRDEYNIRVLNLAFQGRAMTHYWDDPINQAVMAAWDAGIAVVVSAGNSGPEPMTLGAPANVPYVITVGAMTDAYTPGDMADDYVAPFSSFGPTLEGFTKPEIVAPGGHLLGLVPNGSTLSKTRASLRQKDSDYLISGTSQAAAVVSGLAALAIQADPELSPDDLKCRLLQTTQGRVHGPAAAQGFGLVDGPSLIASSATSCANQGLDLKADLAGRVHYLGPNRSIAEARQNISLENTDQEQSLALAASPVTAIESSMIRNDRYVDVQLLREQGFEWQQDQLVELGYWTERVKGSASAVFATDVPLESKVLGSIQGRLLPINEFSGTQLDPVHSAGFIWNLASPESAGFIWNLASPESAGFIWNLASPESAGFIWNLASPESAGFIWNLASPESAGFIWNLASPESAGFIWNLASPESAGFIWNLASPESAGFIWNLASPESAGFIWNLASPESAGFIWNLASSESAGFIWNLASPESAGFIWNL